MHRLERRQEQTAETKRKPTISQHALRLYNQWRASRNLWGWKTKKAQWCQKLQFRKRPFPTGSKNESVPVHSHVPIPISTADVNEFMTISFKVKIFLLSVTNNFPSQAPPCLQCLGLLEHFVIVRADWLIVLLTRWGNLLLFCWVCFYKCNWLTKFSSIYHPTSYLNVARL